VLFLTARDDVDDAARRHGALACLRKPIFADRLLSAVARALPDGRFAIG
jgi:CheY-like chemotaxis protein